MKKLSILLSILVTGIILIIIAFAVFRNHIVNDKVDTIENNYEQNEDKNSQNQENIESSDDDFEVNISNENTTNENIENVLNDIDDVLNSTQIDNDFNFDDDIEGL